MALSTMGAEYVALRTAMRVFIPIRHVLNEIIEALDFQLIKKALSAQYLKTTSQC